MSAGARATVEAIPGRLPPFFGSREVLCTADPEAFFPEQGGASVPRAKSLCAACPFQNDCREWGIKYEAFGIWGGLTAEQREHIRLEQAGITKRPCEICGVVYQPRSPGQRACGVKCGGKLTNKKRWGR